MTLFRDRADAGRRLAERLRRGRGGDVVVVGLPRGGVPVAFEVARALGAPLDVIVVRKLGVPWQPELAMGALGEGGVRIVDDRILRHARVTDEALAEVERREHDEMRQRAARYRGARPRVPLTGHTVVIVDDGIATGSTARAACRVARAQGAREVVLAIPVAPREILPELTGDADEVVCLFPTGDDFFAVGQAYADFTATTDQQVADLLGRAAGPEASPNPPTDTGR